MASDLTPEQRAKVVRRQLDALEYEGAIQREAVIAAAIRAAERAAERRALERAAEVAEPHGIRHLFPATLEQRERQTLICETRRRIAARIRTLAPPEDDTDAK